MFFFHVEGSILGSFFLEEGTSNGIIRLFFLHHGDRFFSRCSTEGDIVESFFLEERTSIENIYIFCSFLIIEIAWDVSD